MSIHVGGCVENVGEYDTPPNCTLGQAIQLAGGIKDNPPYTPTGVITIKTKVSENVIKTIKTVNFLQSPSVLDDEIIKDNDILIIQLDGEKFLG
jgi:protein involved in polysaccharide export with SLBB domain